MKRALILSLVISYGAFAGTTETGNIIPGESIFLTECPDGFIAIDEPDMTIANNCSGGYLSAGVEETCFTEEGRATGSCIMYAPADRSYYDAFGTYEFTDPCPME